MDFDQFFYPMQREYTEVDPMPDADSAYSLVYGNHGGYPTMAMAQVGMDSDFDFGQFFKMDPSMEELQTITEDHMPSAVHGGFLIPPEVDPLTEELNRILNEIPSFDEEEEMTDITGKKRDRRSSLDMRMDQRNGIEQNRIQEMPYPAQPNADEVKIKAESATDAASHFLSDERRRALPMDMSMGQDDFGDTFHGFQDEGNHVRNLVKDMVEFDIHRGGSIKSSKDGLDLNQH